VLRLVSILVCLSVPRLLFSQAEVQKLETKLLDAMEALKVEQASSERGSRRAALEQHRLDRVRHL